MKKIVTVAIILVIGLSILWLVQSSDTEQSPTVPIEYLATTTPVDGNKDPLAEPTIEAEKSVAIEQQTYRNDEFGVELKYPNDWAIDEDNHEASVKSTGEKALSVRFIPLDAVSVDSVTLGYVIGKSIDLDKVGEVSAVLSQEPIVLDGHPAVIVELANNYRVIGNRSSLEVSHSFELVYNNKNKEFLDEFLSNVTFFDPS